MEGKEERKEERDEEGLGKKRAKRERVMEETNIIREREREILCAQLLGSSLYVRTCRR